MDEEVRTTEMTVEEPVGVPAARQELETLLNEILPEEQRTGDVDQMALDWIRKQIEMNDRLAETIGEDPRAAQLFADIVNGGKPGVSLVRHFGRSLINAEEGTPEYDELMAADAEFMNERAAVAERDAAYKAHADEWFNAFRAYLEKNGLDVEKYMTEVEESIIEPALDLVVDEKLFARLVKAVDYDKDVEDAFEAGNIKGRNTNINEMRAKPSDGMPKGLNSAAPAVEKKRRTNPLIARALEA